MNRDPGGWLPLFIFLVLVALLFVFSLPNGKRPTQINDAGKLVPLKGSEKPLKTANSNSTGGSNLKPAVVNLPPGERFMYMILKNEAQEMDLPNRGSDMFVTSKRMINEKPRKITIWGSGSMPYSWEPLLYIQEH